MGLKILRELVKWEFGIKLVYGVSRSAGYVLGRQIKAQMLVEAKFRVVEATINSAYFSLMDTVMAEQVQKYYQGGFYGASVVNEDPMYKVEGTT